MFYSYLFFRYTGPHCRLYQWFALFSDCKQQQQARPGPVADNRDGSEEVQRGPKRAALVERKVNQEYPQEFSVAKYVFLF